MSKTTFALYFGNRGFFPESLIAGARREMSGRLKALGYGTLMLDAAATRYGAVETREQGPKYAEFLKTHAGQYDGVILCLPNFGDENGRRRRPARRGRPDPGPGLPRRARQDGAPPSAATLSAASSPSWTCSASTACRSPRSRRTPFIPAAKRSPGRSTTSPGSAGRPGA